MALKADKISARQGDQAGQAVLEYVLLMVIVVGAYMILVNGMGKAGLAAKVLEPIQQDYRRAYQYGHPKAKGFEDGTPEMHPRVESGKGNFRLFIHLKQ